MVLPSCCSSIAKVHPGSRGEWPVRSIFVVSGHYLLPYSCMYISFSVYLPDHFCVFSGAVNYLRSE